MMAFGIVALSMHIVSLDAKILRLQARGSARTTCKMLSQFLGQIYFSCSLLHTSFGLPIFLSVRLCLLVVVYSKLWHLLCCMLKASIQWCLTEFRKFRVLGGTSSPTPAEKTLHCWALLFPSAFKSCLDWCLWSLNPGSVNKSPALATSLSLLIVSNKQAAVLNGSKPAKHAEVEAF